MQREGGREPERAATTHTHDIYEDQETRRTRFQVLLPQFRWSFLRLLAVSTKTDPETDDSMQEVLWFP